MYEFDQGTKTSDYQLVARAIQLLDKSDRLTSIVNTKFCLLHSPLKLEKSAISKVQNSIICIFKNGKNQFCTRKKFKPTKNAIFGLISGAKIDFLPFLKL